MADRQKPKSQTRHGIKKGCVTVPSVKEGTSREKLKLSTLKDSNSVSKAALFYKNNYLGELPQMIYTPTDTKKTPDRTPDRDARQKARG